MDILKFTRSSTASAIVAGTIAKWLVLLACLISAGNAIVRYLISYSSNGLLEIQWYMFGGIVLLGAAQTLRLNEHVRVDLLYSSVSDRTRLWIDIVGFTLFLLPVMAYLVYLTWPFFYNSFRSQEVSDERRRPDFVAGEGAAAARIFPSVHSRPGRARQAHRGLERKTAVSTPTTKPRCNNFLPPHSGSLDVFRTAQCPR